MRKGLFAVGFATVGMVFSLAACGNQAQADKYEISITNKEALQALWYDSGDARKLELTIKLNGEEKNASQAISEGDVTITSSNKDVLTVVNQMLTPKGVGETTVEAVYGGVKDSVKLTITKTPTNKDRFGTDHEGNLADPFSNEDAIKVAKALDAEGSFGSTEYYIGGVVEEFYHAPGSRNDNKVSYYLTPAQEKGERFEVYLAGKDATASAQWTKEEIWVGDTVVAHGSFAKYNSQYETSSAVVDSVSKVERENIKTISATVAEALAVGKELADGAATYDNYEITGYVVKKDSNNYFLADTKEVAEDVDVKTLFEYFGAKGDDFAEKLLKGAKIKVVTDIKNYHGQIENSYLANASSITVIEAGEPWSAPAAEPVTVAQALAKIKAIPTPAAAGSVEVENGKLFEVTGVVVKKGNTWTDESQYKNADFYIADEPMAEFDNSNALQVWRYSNKEIFDSLVVNETYVKVTCKLVGYFRSVENVITLSATETNQDPTVEKTVADLWATKFTTTDYADIDTGGTVRQYLIGKVVEEYNNASTYGNFYIETKDGSAKILVYGMYDKANVRYDKMDAATKPVIGDVIVVYGPGSVYNEVKQAKNTMVVQRNGVVLCDDPLTLESIKLNKVEAEIDVDGEVALTASPVPYTATLGTVTWASSAEAVATVGTDGKVTGVAAGEATITATAGELSASCAVTVNQPAAGETKVTKTVSQLKEANGWTVVSGQGDKTEFKVLPFNLDEVISVSGEGQGNSGTVWNTNNPEIRMYANGDGDASLTFTAATGYTIKTIKMTFTLNNGDSMVALGFNSEDVVEVNAASKTFNFAKKTGASSNPQFKLNAVEVVYVQAA